LNILSREDLGTPGILPGEDAGAASDEPPALQGSSTATFEGGAKYPASVVVDLDVVIAVALRPSQ
jgi:hypothetical protein